MKLLDLKSALLFFLVSAIVGCLILVVHHFVIGIEMPGPGEYYLDGLVERNYDWISAAVFVVAGALLQKCFGENPIVIGAGLVLIFPLVTFYEISVYPTSHNLLPFETIEWAFYSVPGFLGAVFVYGSAKYKQSHP